MLNSLINKYNALPLPAKSSLWFAVCSVIQKGLGMLTTPIFTRLFTTEEFGVFSLYNAWEQLFLLLLALPLFQSLHNLYVKDLNANKILSSVIGLNITLCSIWLFFYVVLRNQICLWLDLSVTICDLLFLQLLFQPVITNWMVHQAFFYKYKRMTLISLLSSFSSVILALAFVLSVEHYKVEARILASVLVFSIIGILLIIDVFKTDGHFYDKYIWRFSLTFCIPLLPHFLSEYILSTSNRLLINMYCSRSEVAIFSVAYSLALILTLITSSINTSFSPYQMRKLKSKDYSTLSPLAIGIYLFLSIFLFLIMIFGPELVLLMGGHKYKDAVNLLPPICLGVFFNYMFQIFARVETFYEKKIYLVSATMICSIISISMNYVLIPILGYSIAAYTTLLCYVSLCLTHYYFYRRVCYEFIGGIHIYDRKQLLTLSLGMIVLSFIILYSYNYLFIRFILLLFVLTFVIYKRNYFLNMLNLNIK